MNRMFLVSFRVFLLAGAVALAAQSPEQSCCARKTAEPSAHYDAAGSYDGPAAASSVASYCSKDAADASTLGDDARSSPPADGHGSMGRSRHAGHGGGMGMGAVMPDAMRLLHNHASLTRTTEEIHNGVRTVTTTTDPAVLDLLRRHPREMYSFYESGGVVRPHDPMFSELSRVADKVSMEFKDIENGIEVIATSDDPEVVKLIRAHAAKVDDFVKRGHAALHEGAPLPEDYHPDH